jgi:hypothetical protein
MKPLAWLKKKGITIPTTIKTTASARVHHGGSRRSIAARHSVS